MQLMSVKSKARKSSHSVFSIRLHLVFVTKYRKKVLNKAILQRMETIFTDVCLKAKCQLLEFGGESDHVHLLVDLHPDNNISNFVCSLKSTASRMLWKEFENLLSKTYWKRVLWSSSYYVASSGGANIEMLSEYINNQNSPMS